MTERKETQTKRATSASAADVVNQAEKADIQLSENEKAAIKVATGEAGSKKYKLSDPKTQYGEEGFTLAGDQEKELPENPSDALIARIRSGFIVEA